MTQGFSHPIQPACNFTSDACGSWAPGLGRQTLCCSQLPHRSQTWHHSSICTTPVQSTSRFFTSPPSRVCNFADVCGVIPKFAVLIGEMWQTVRERPCKYHPCLGHLGKALLSTIDPSVKPDYAVQLHTCTRSRKTMAKISDSLCSIVQIFLVRDSLELAATGTVHISLASCVQVF